MCIELSDFNGFRRVIVGGALIAAACSSETFQPQAAEGTGGASDGGAGGGTGGARSGGSTGATGGSGGATVEGDSGASEPMGSGGQAGGDDAGGADAGGVEPDSGVAECVHDSDCAALTCNGEPRCNAGKCDPGLPCVNPDAVHCTVTCVKSGGRASCEVQGKDADGDGYLDAACVSGGGKDCDDANPAIFEGAAEKCDGVDNDCDGAIDVEDGLPLGGTPKLIREMTGTASLGMAASPGGYALMVMNRDNLGDRLSTQVEVVTVSTAGLSTSFTVAGDFGFEPAIGHNAGEFVLFDRNPGESTARFVRFPLSGAPVRRLLAPRPGFTTMSFTAPAEPSADTHTAVFSGVVYQNREGLCSVSLSPGDTAGCTPVLPIGDGPEWALSPAGHPRLPVWLQASTAIYADHELRLQFTSFDEGEHEWRPATLLHQRSVTITGATDEVRTFMSIRPQAAHWKDTSLIGWLEPTGMRFAQVDASGTSCKSPVASPIAYWGMANSLLMFSKPGATQPDVYAVGVSADGTPVMARIKGCSWGHVVPLSTAGAKASLGGPNTYLGKPHLEVGHPVIASYFKGQIGVAWVETPGANGLHRLMFRSFGPEVCR